MPVPSRIKGSIRLLKNVYRSKNTPYTPIVVYPFIIGVYILNKGISNAESNGST